MFMRLTSIASSDGTQLTVPISKAVPKLAISTILKGQMQMNGNENSTMCRNHFVLILVDVKMVWISLGHSGTTCYVIYVSLTVLMPVGLSEF